VDRLLLRSRTTKQLQRQGDVFLGGQIIEEMERLKYESGSPGTQRGPVILAEQGELLSGQLDNAGLRRVEPGQ
jgi:hypothetical protein